MRRLVVANLALLSLTWGARAFAQDTTAPPSTSAATVSAPDSSTTTTTTTATTAPPVGTTTTTQAAVDVTPNPVVVPVARSTESGATESTTFVNRPLLVTGLLFFGGTYAASAGVAAESNRAADHSNLYYPLAGPWMDLAQRDCTAIHPCINEGGNRTLLVLDGVTQGVGALAVLTSFFVPEKKSRHWFIIGGDKVHASPATVGTGYGMAAVGRF